MSCPSQKATESLSLIDPPGCITAFMPASCAISTQSGNGKNASDAITAPLRSNLKFFAFTIACFNASTLEVCPTPLAISCPFFASTMVLDFVCFTSLLANNRSFISSSSGSLFVTVLSSPADSVTVSLSWTTTPFSNERNCLPGRSNSFILRMIRFFFCIRISRAFSWKAGAMITSKNNLSISSAVASSTSLLVISIPPNAEMGSPARASFQDSGILSLEASPQALLCFNMAKVWVLKSLIRHTAASISSKLL